MQMPSVKSGIENLLTSSLPRVYPPFFNAVFSGMDAEEAHEKGVAGIRAAERTGASALLRSAFRPDPWLARTVMGLRFPTPFGLAAGFDKHGLCTTALADLGFGHIEVGTVTAQAQPGNPKPRLFRLVEDKAVVNRMGFNNEGAAAVAPRLAATRATLTERFGPNRPILGANIGKTKVVELADAAADYRLSARLLSPHADYLAVNVSSPNTPGLRQLQEIATLEPLLRAVREEADAAVTDRHLPLLVKIAPDLADEDIVAVADMARTLPLDGVIATNTTIARPGSLRSDRALIEKIGAGGLSGPVLAERSLDVLRLLREELPAEAVIISCGGVTTADDVKERLAAGADLVQGYTALIYEGPSWPGRIARELTAGR